MNGWKRNKKNLAERKNNIPIEALPQGLYIWEEGREIVLIHNTFTFRQVSQCAIRQGQNLSYLKCKDSRIKNEIICLQWISKIA